MLLLWRDHGARCGHVLPASRRLDSTCQNGAVRSGILELVHIIHCHFTQLLGSITRGRMATLDQKSPNVLLQSLCCRITGKSEGNVTSAAVNASMLRATPGTVTPNLIQKTRHFIFSLSITNHVYFTHNLKSPTESVSSNVNFGVSFLQQIAHILIIIHTFYTAWPAEDAVFLSRKVAENGWN